MAISTLNDFLDNLLRTQKIENGKSGFSDWLAQQNLDPAATYAAKLKAANAAYDRALPTYGAAGESLARSGLSGTGYAAYLHGVAYAEKQKAANAAMSDYVSDMKRAAGGYASYLENNRKNAASLYRSVSQAIGSSGILDTNAAKEYAVSSGLDEATAERAAKEGVSLAVRKLRDSVISTILSKSLTKDAAVLYARSRGLPEEDVLLLGDLADKLAQKKSSGFALY